MSMKERIRKKYGSLRAAAAETGVNYYRLSQIVNGWTKPKDAEISALKITPQELKATLKVADARAT